MDGHECGGFYFYSNFDSANLCKVEYVPPNETIINSSTFSGKSDCPVAEFNLWTKPDCAGTEFENGNRTWFYFGIKGTNPSSLVKFNLIDLNKQAKLYSQGMGPVYRILPGKQSWDRICDKPTFNNDKNVFTLSFKCKTPENVNSVLYLAFTYPYSYTELQNKLTLIDNRFKNDELSTKDDIYYVRETVCHSLEGRKLDLITVSSFHDISTEREPRLANLFPDTSNPRPYRFIGKKIIFISARVHPGETPSSFVFNGFLNLLLTRDDLVAINLRRNYVFKLIPCLNPDGVANGHYRTDTRGVNLNRVYLNPRLSEHPTIYSARALIRYYHYGFVKEEVPDEDLCEAENNLSHMSIEERNVWCRKCLKSVKVGDGGVVSEGKVTCGSCGEVLDLNQGDTEPENESGLFLYLDMHGHASKKGIFMYGNHFDDVESNVKCMLLPKIMSLNNYNFHFTACNFTERNMYLKDKRDGMSKEGSGRVAVFKLTGLVQSYTLECNYNTGRLVNVLPPTIKETGKNNQNVLVPPKYTPQVFEEVGKAIGLSILDLSSQNPFTRLPHSEYHSLNGLREWLRVHCSNGVGELHPAGKVKLRHSSSVHSGPQGVKAAGARSVIVKTRSMSKYGPKKLKAPRPSAASKKEKTESQPQPSCSNATPSTSSTRIRNIKSSKSLTIRPRLKNADKRRPNSVQTVNHIAKNIQNTNGKKLKEKTNEDLERIKLKEIHFVKDPEGKKVIAKYQSDDKEEDNLIVAWDSANANPQVFSHKSFLSSRCPEGTGKRSFRVHNFQKGNPSFKVKRNSRIFKKLSNANEGSKIKKSKVLKKKVAAAVVRKEV